MCDHKRQDDLALIFNVADSAIIADAVPPQLALISGQCVSQLARVLRLQDALAKIAENARLNLPIQFADLLLCGKLELNSLLLMFC